MTDGAGERVQDGQGRVEAVCVTRAVKPDGETGTWTGIDKHPVASITVHGTGVVGDRVLDEADHGGRDKAVYAYSAAAAAHWAAELGTPLAPGWFGENLRLADVDVDGALVGERWRIGEQVLVEVTQPRIPCMTFARHAEQPHWVKRFTAAGLPGTYLRVLETGDIRPGDAVTVEHRPDHGVSVAGWFRDRDPADARALLAAEAAGLDLAPSLVASVERAVRRA